METQYLERKEGTMAYTDYGGKGELVFQPLRGEPELRYLLSTLAAVHGYPKLAEKIEALDVEPD